MLLNDPLDAFVESNGLLDIKISCTASSREADQMRHSLLWRQEPEESLSDWKIIFEIDDADTNLNDETAPLTTTFHVHRIILASVSTYFQSLFKKRKQNQTSEHETQTSTIKLHPLAIESFPVFLDYVYNVVLGRLGFEPSNAVALRHLAIYFGVDKLLKDITELILIDIRNEAFRDDYYNTAKIFNDDKLLLGIGLQRSMSGVLRAVAPGIFRTLKEQPEVHLKEENSLLSSWRQVKMHASYYHGQPFFMLQNSEKFPNICVQGAGLEVVNGIYKLFGRINTTAAYTNGICDIKKIDYSWHLRVSYQKAKGRRDWEGFSLYKAESDTDNPPSTGWKVCDSNYAPAPTIVSMNPK
jgi:hypothetical protein